MIPQKFIWDKKVDNLETIRKRLIGLINHNVENKRNPEKPLTIFEVGEIEEMVIDSFGGIGSPEFKPNGELNYKSTEVLMWGFFVKYGLTMSNGCTQSMVYKFMVPRQGLMKNDLMLNTIMFDPNHPFIFYK